MSRRARWVIRIGIGLVALSFFLKNVYLGLGIGGMERIVSYPQTIWMIVFGAYVLSVIASGNPDFHLVASGFASNGYGDRSPGHRGRSSRWPSRAVRPPLPIQDFKQPIGVDL